MACSDCYLTNKPRQTLYAMKLEVGFVAKLLGQNGKDKIRGSN